MIVTQPIIEENNNKIYYKVKVDNRDLFFCVDRRFKNLISTSSNAAAVAMLLPAMVRGEDLHIKGQVSLQLYHNINFMLQNVILNVIPSLNKIKLTADSLINDTPKDKEVVLTGFSAGIDAFTTLEDYYINPVSDLKITHCIFNNVGSLESYGDNVYNERFERMNTLIGKDLGLPYILLDSNLNDFYRHKSLGFEQTHTIRNSVIPHLLSNLGLTFLYSSTFDYSKVSVTPSKDISIVDTIILPLLSTNNVTLMSAGSEYTRLQKTLKISKSVNAFEYLDLCIGKDKKYINCGHCRKCKRALRTFETNNTINNFTKIFNLHEYNKIRDKYNKQLRKRDQLNDNELYLYLKDNNLL